MAKKGPGKAPRRRGKRAKLQGEAIEPRILYSATWIDATDGAEEQAGTAAPHDAAVDALAGQCTLRPDDLASVDTGDGDTTGGPTEPATPPRLEIVFVGGDVPDAEQLLADLAANTGDDRTLVVVQLDSNRDGIEQIGETLAEHGDISAIHIISHGGDGRLSLGGATLDQQTLVARGAEIATWGASFTDNADILIYGCDVAATAAGDAFVANLAELTGADVAASEDTTGHHSLGGDWDLEEVVGEVETGVAVREQFQSEWEGVLPTYAQFTSFEDEHHLNNSPHGQTFRHTSGGGSYTVDRIELAMSVAAGGPNRDITVELLSSWNGTVLASATISTLAVPTTLGWVAFDIPEVTLNDGTSYTIRVSTDQNPGHVHVGYDSGGGYANGTRLDRDGDAVSGDMAFRVMHSDAPPVANAGPDQTVAENATVTLTAAGSSDPEAQPLSYTWTQLSGPAVSLSSTTAVSPTFIAPDLLANTTLTFRVAVSDGSSTTFDTVSITVNANNDAPAANAGPDQTVTEGGNVTLTAAGSSDPEGQGLTYTWTQTGGPAVTLSNANAVSPTFTAPEALSDTPLTFQVAASDGTTTSFDTITVTVDADNDAPAANAGPDQTVTEEAVVTLTAAGSSDPEGQGLTYAWTQTGGPVVTLSNANAVAPTFTAPQAAGNYTMTFQVAVSDGTTTTFDTVTITVNADDDAPAANAGPDQTVTEEAVVTLTAAGSSDPEGQGLNYTWAQTGGPAVTLSNPNAMTPTFTAPWGVADYTLTFEVTASDGANSSTDTVSVLVQHENVAPTADAGSDVDVTAGDTIALNGSRSRDFDLGALQYRWTQVSGPQVTITGIDTATPQIAVPSDASGTAVFRLDVSDGTTTTSDTVSLHIQAAAPQPQPEAEPEGGNPAPMSQPQLDPSRPTNGASGAPTWFTAPRDVEPGSREEAVGPNAGDTGDERDDGPRLGADAGPELSVTEGTYVRFSGRVENGGGASAQFLWTQVAGIPVTVDKPLELLAGFRAPSGLDADAVLVFELRATTNGASATDTVVVTVHPAAAPDAAEDLGTATSGTMVSLDLRELWDAMGSSIEWRQVDGTAVVLSDAHVVAPSFKAPEVFVGEDLEFEVASKVGNQVVSKRVRVHVDPVEVVAYQRWDPTATEARDPEQEAQHDGSGWLRGIGRIWASLLGFMTTRFPRPPKPGA